MSGIDEKPRLLVLTSTFPRWPDDHEPPFVYDLARHLTDRFAVTVLAPHAPGAKRREMMAGIQVQRFHYAPERLEKLAYAGGIPNRLRAYPWLYALVPLFLLAQTFAAWRLVRRLSPVAVHAHWLIPGGLIGVLLKNFSGRHFNLLVTAHGGDVYGMRGRLSAGLKRWVLRRADTVSVVSTALATALRASGVQPRDLVVQAMGADLSGLFVPQSRIPGPPTLVYAGRLVDKKGVDTLLHAAAIALRSLPDLRVTVAGHGPDLVRLRQFAESHGIAKNVTFSGPYVLAQLPTIYATADLAVFPFRAAPDGDQDGLGLAVIEAMGCEVPVLGSDIGPFDDLLEPGVTGLCAPANNPQAFADRILEAIADPTASRGRAKHARERVVARYDWPVVAARYAELLNSPITGSSANPRRADN